jgi:N-dimethylarginine dimethylaminohydrolase
MTPPAFFAVDYAINPWMDVATPVDVGVARAQWEALHRTYLRLGHRVDVIEPVPGLPDMVYAANGGFIAGDVAIVARFRFAERAGESRAYAEWMSSLGYRPVFTGHVNEGQGDLLMVGDTVLAGYGFRTDRCAHAEISAALGGMPVVSLELVDPRFYHLDTALAVLDERTIAFYPPAFSAAAQDRLHALFPDALVVGSADAYVFGLNVVSDGLHVVMPAAATGFATQLLDAGFEPVGVDLSELLKGGGSVKCCTLEVFP